MSTPRPSMICPPRTSWLPTAMIVLLIGLLAGCMYRLVWLERHMGPELRDSVVRQQITQATYLGVRGRILDYNPLSPGADNVLAVSYVVQSVYVDPPEVAACLPDLVKDLSAIFDRSMMRELDAAPADALYAEAAELDIAHPHSYLRKQLAGLIVRRRWEKLVWEVGEKVNAPSDVPGRRFIWVRRLISPDEELQVRALMKQYRGLGLTPELTRRYPGGTLASHIVGWTDPFGVGREGIERHFDKILTGQDGFKRTIADARRRPIALVSDHDYTEPRDGLTVVLNINAMIQSAVEDVLAKTVSHYEAESGVAVVMDPQTGAVLAMANRPTFSPADYRNADKDALRNRCLTDPFEPGSIFKWVVVAGAVEKGIVKPQTRFNCYGGAWTVGRRTIHDVHGYGWLTVREIIGKSSNIGMSQIGMKMGAEKLYRCLKDFGLGEKTGVELSDAEGVGQVRPLALWGITTSVPSVSFGQEVSVTPIQMVTAFSACVNGGWLLRPRLVREIRDESNPDSPDNEVFSRTVVRRVLSKSTSDAMIDMLEGVVTEGTGKKAASDRVRVIGKTGTAQIAEGGVYRPGQFTGSFIGGAFVKDPKTESDRACKLVCIVSIRKPRPEIGYYGGTVAAPAVKEIFERAMPYVTAAR